MIITFARPAAGEVWRTLASPESYALVVFARHAETGSGSEDLRVLPVRFDRAAPSLASELDLVIPATENTVGETIVAQCWNSRELTRPNLAQCVGQVSATALAAARDIEFAMLVPTASAPSAWIGQAAADDPLVADFQRAERTHWDDIEDRLRGLIGSGSLVFEWSDFRVGEMFKGHVVDSLPLSDGYVVWVGPADQAMGSSTVVTTPVARAANDNLALAA